MQDQPAKRQLKLDILELETAFESVGSYGSDLAGLDDRAYLDLQTGTVVYAGDPDSSHEDDEAEDPDKYLDDRYLEVPDDGGRMDYRDLEDFVATLDPGPPKRELARALEGRGAFRRFKNIVHGGGDLELRHAWHNFQQRRLRERITAWLEEAGIQPVWDQDIFQERQLPNRRPELLTAVLEFVRRARVLTGVHRFALLGSLTTDKAHPKDVDLLVIIDDTTPLEGLAKAARRLKGKTMQTGDSCGADVFLADASGRYLGRTCPWKDCRPGIRQSCEAQHCGRRQYLYDDLQNVRLPPKTIANPPIQLWPNPHSFSPGSPVPPDVAGLLLAPLQAEFNR